MGKNVRLVVLTNGEHFGESIRNTNPNSIQENFAASLVLNAAIPMKAHRNLGGHGGTPMKTILIRITKNDIVKGKSMSCYFGPLALVLCRSAFKQAEVGNSFFLDWYLRKIKLPEQAIRFIADFDSKKPVNPFNFKLEVP